MPERSGPGRPWWPPLRTALVGWLAAGAPDGYLAARPRPALGGRGPRPVGSGGDDAWEAGPARPRPAAADGPRARPPSPPGCIHLAAHPQVALMFISGDEMAHEATWRTWLGAAERLLPAAPLQALGCPDAALEAAEHGCRLLERAVAPPPLRRQLLFNVYLSRPPGAPPLPATSLFAAALVPSTRRDDGEQGFVDAAMALLRRALKTRRNHKFVLLDGSTLPLYPPFAVYAQLTAEPLSRIDACFDKSGRRTAIERYSRTMSYGSAPLPRPAWRKSSPWVALNRQHAGILALDARTAGVFVDRCRLGDACLSREHWAPTALALHGTENGTDCTGGLRFEDWGEGFVPHELGLPALTVESWEAMRNGAQCRPEVMRNLAERQFLRLGERPLGGRQRCEAAPPWRPDEAASGPANCPLFAGPFPPEVAPRAADLAYEMFAARPARTANWTFAERLEAQRQGAVG